MDNESVQNNFYFEKSGFQIFNSRDIDLINLTLPYDILFILGNEEIPIIDILKTLDLNLNWIAIYGFNCESIHDQIDEEFAFRQVTQEKSKWKNKEIITTWHDEEPIQEVISFFKTNDFSDGKVERKIIVANESMFNSVIDELKI